MRPRSASVSCVTALLLVAAATVPASAQTGPLCPIDENGRVAEVFYETSAIYWEPIVEHERLRLSVLTPCGTIEKVFERGQTASFDLEEVAGDLDGQYSWELRIDPVVDPDVRKALEVARAENDLMVPLQLQQKGLLPSGPLVDSGAFTVEQGTIVDPSGEEERGAKSTVAAAGLAPSRASNGSAAFASDGLGTEGAPLTRATALDQVIPDDLIVQGSECVGFDCVNNEDFQFDTIRLKENNLRIKFMDTSTTTGFPNIDWQLRANESASGGLSAFFVDEMGTGNTVGQAPESSPLVIEANSPTNSIRVDSTGRIGFRTANPVLDLHVSTGNTPALRLEQTTASGFSAQTWDVAGNEANFFVRDVTGGSQLPFRIQPGADSNSIFIASDNDVGVGTSSPGASLHVRRTSGASAQIRVEDTTGDSILNAMELLNAGEVRFAIQDTSAASRRWELRTTGSNFQFTRNDAPSADLAIDTNGNVTIRGNLVTGGGGLCDPGPCDGVFAPDYEVESIEEHASYMWANRHLWGVGPTPEGEPINLSQKTTGILHELEKAHIYIEQLHRQKSALEERQTALEEQIARLTEAFEELAAERE